MKPIEIFEYKQKWLPGYTLNIHSDLRWDTVPWCRKNFESHKWDYKKYTDNYTDTFYFEDSTDRDKFLETFDYENGKVNKMKKLLMTTALALTLTATPALADFYNKQVGNWFVFGFEGTSDKIVPVLWNTNGKMVQHFS